MDDTRRHVLQFFNASPEDYCVIFTANATGAIKLVAESFPFEASSSFLLFADNHNSVHGIRQYATAAQASVRYIRLARNLRVHPDEIVHHLHHHDTAAPNLFAYPAQSNFSGVQHSLTYISHAHRHRWFVLLDAAAFVPTSPLDLSNVRPDFVSISFYKMFGLPTGVGALVARRSSLNRLRRPWFAGGTVRYSAVGTRTHALTQDESAFEDGTLNFLSISTVKDGLEFLSSVGMSAIHDHVTVLTERLLKGMGSLRYANGAPLLRLYGPTLERRTGRTNDRKRGGCVAFDVLTSDGKRVDPTRVETAANKRMISLRTGCFCNPGAAERALRRNVNMERSCLSRLAQSEWSMETMSNCMGEPLGCVRVSVGIASNTQDIDYFLMFMSDFANGLGN